MKGIPFKRHLILLGAVILLIGVMVPLASFAKSSTGEPHGRPPQPPKVTFKTNPTTGKSDPTATIMQGCPAAAPINPTPFRAGDVITGTATFTSTDTGESSETEEANNALEVFVTIPPVSVKLNQTSSFTFIARAGDNLNACFVTYDGDEVGTISYTITPPPDLTPRSPCVSEFTGKPISCNKSEAIIIFPEGVPPAIHKAEPTCEGAKQGWIEPQDCLSDEQTTDLFLCIAKILPGAYEAAETGDPAALQDALQDCFSFVMGLNPNNNGPMRVQ